MITRLFLVAIPSICKVLFTTVSFTVIPAIIVAALIATATAETTEQSHEVLRKSYFRLKNIDPKISDKDAWQKVVTEYQYFFERNEGLNDKAYFEYASLLQEYGKAMSDPKLLDNSIEVFDDLANKFPQSNLADDALLKETEILKLRGASAATLKDAYQAIIGRFPSSDSAEVARVLLSRISEAESQNVFSSENKNSVAGKEDLGNSPSLPVVVLDPGHGGEDFGAENEMGLFEKDVVLSIALEAERLINTRGFAKPILTRRTDTFVPLLERVAIANNNNAALFLSLHNNASPKKNQSGLNTYVLDNSSDEASRLLAERENKSSGTTDDTSDLDFIISDLIQTSKHPKSLLLANSIDRFVSASVKSVWPKAPSTKIRKAPFYVLVGARMPCALVELFFLDHNVDSEFLVDPSFRKKLAEGIVNGVEAFLVKSGG